MDIQKRRKLIIILLIVFLVLSVCGYFVYKSYSDNKPVKVSAEVKKDKKAGKKEIKNEKREEATQTKTNNKVVANTVIKRKATNKKATPKSNKKVTFSDKKTSTKPAKKKIWVVDQVAWTETVTKYKQIHVSIEYAIFNNGHTIDMGKYYDDGRFEKIAPDGAATTYLENTPGSGSWRNAYRDEYEQVPYTETINHPEEGHWEYR